jgi:hypothetical protein
MASVTIRAAPQTTAEKCDVVRARPGVVPTSSAQRMWGARTAPHRDRGSVGGS